MTGGQTAIGLAAAALVIANQVEHEPLQLGSVFGNSTHTTAKVFGVAEKQIKEIGLEVVAVIVLTVVAGIGNTGAKLAGVVLAGLWLLFLMNMHKGKAATPAHSLSVVNGSKSPSQAVA